MRYCQIEISLVIIIKYPKNHILLFKQKNKRTDICNFPHVAIVYHYIIVV